MGKKKKIFRYLSICIFTALTLVLLLMIFVFSIYRIEGYSMQPTLNTNSRIIIIKKVNKKNLKRFDLVVCKDPLNKKEYIIKRIIGLPNEGIRIKKGRVFINNQRIAEPYLLKNDDNYFKDSNNFDLYSIKKDNYFLMGDNRSISKDSRDFGTIAYPKIHGKAIFCYWPLSELRFIK